MKKHIKKAISHPLISGSSIIFIGSFLVNGLNYVFNLVMGRFLSVTEYGVLVSLVAILSIMTILQLSFTSLFAKFSAQYSAQKNKSLMSELFKDGLKITVLVSVAIFIVLSIVSIPLAHFLHIDNLLLLFIIFLTSSFTILYSLPFGILQGELKFIKISILNVISIVIKIGVGVFLVVLGLDVLGALSGILLAFIIPYLLSFLFISKIKINTSSKKDVHFFDEFKKVSLPFLIASIGIIFLQSSDVIFARHFLSAEQAGQFAALSLMGKAIFYITSPIYFVFLPVIAHKREQKQNTFSTLILALGIVLACNIFFASIYIFFPSVVLSLFFPQQSYAALSSFLGIYSIYILIFSLAYLIHTYLLSVGKIGIYKPSILVAITYVLLLNIFHSSIQQIIFVLIASSFLLLISLLVYYLKYEHT